MIRIVRYLKSGFLILMLLVFAFAGIEKICAQGLKAEGESDTTAKKELSLNAYPYIYYTPETELAFGAGGIVIFYTSDYPQLQPSKFVAGGYYSTKKQYKFNLDPALYLLKNNLYLYAPLSFGYFVDKYFGIGPNSPDDGDEDYISRVYTASLFVQVPSYWFTSDRTGLIFDYNYTEMVNKQTNQELIQNTIPGTNGGSSFGIGIQGVWDSRNNLFYPTDGKYSSLKLQFYPFGNFNYYSFELDIRNYTSLAKDHILAGQGYFIFSGGDIPFYKVPALGGPNRMRGYYYGRYRDNSYFTIQLEYRHFFWKRFGYTAFGDVGAVASSPNNVRIDEFKYTYGAGLRYLFNKDEQVNLRADIGITGEGTIGVYFAIEEAF